MSQNKTPFTKDEYQKMQVKLKKLESERPEIIIRLQAAREMGDLSENGAYQYAKLELRSADSRIRYLTNLLQNGEVKESSKTGIIDFGSQVTLDNGKEKQTYLMVSKLESDPRNHKLSLDSPLGKAIIGKQVGDRIKVQAPAGTLNYTIVKID